MEHLTTGSCHLCLWDQIAKERSSLQINWLLALAAGYQVPGINLRAQDAPKTTRQNKDHLGRPIPAHVLAWVLSGHECLLVYSHGTWMSLVSWAVVLPDTGGEGKQLSTYILVQGPESL